ncbi:hypothetical protein EV128_10481 [Rhizobium azibense]|nr:hypothetical protein EV128_10481 [Rhizobium azibense]
MLVLRGRMRQNRPMTQHLVDLFNSRLEAYNALLDAKIAATSVGADRRAFASKKFEPIVVGEVSEDELRRRLRMQRLRLGSVLKARAVELLRYIEPGELLLGRYTREFPETQVSSACLRWYISRINEEARDLGLAETGLPQYRPRSRDTAYSKVKQPWPGEH